MSLLQLALSVLLGASTAPTAPSAPTAPGTDSDKGKPLAIDYEVFTRESIVEIGGKKFRKVEYMGKVAYLELLDREQAAGDLQVICGEEGALKANAKAPLQIVAAVKVTKRSSFFVEGLRQVCVQQADGRSRVAIEPALRVGFMFDEGNDKAILKNKRIFISPFSPGVGFSAEW